jgi:2-amino-4-hydroxy-6-hydroxymethyldihydropteridine diphosphokinase
MKDAVFLGLGSNLGDRLRHLQAAIEGLQKGGCRLIKSSSVYETPPWGLEEQPAFLNMVIQVGFDQEPIQLMELALYVEHQLGRTRNTKWGPRTIDIDLLAFGDLKVLSQRLVIPHPLLQERAFVLLPWAEIAPDFVVAGLGKSVQELLDGLAVEEKEGIVKRD